MMKECNHWNIGHLLSVSISFNQMYVHIVNAHGKNVNFHYASTLTQSNLAKMPCSTDFYPNQLGDSNQQHFAHWLNTLNH